MLHSVQNLDAVKLTSQQVMIVGVSHVQVQELDSTWKSLMKTQTDWSLLQI